jgi:hypothetical protein
VVVVAAVNTSFDELAMRPIEVHAFGGVEVYYRTRRLSSSKNVVFQGRELSVLTKLEFV